MRALWMIIFVALVSTACSGSDGSGQTSRADTGDVGVPAPAVGDSFGGADVSTADARTLGEPAQDSDEDSTEALAFEDPVSDIAGDGEEGADDAEGADAPDTPEPPESTELSRLIDQLSAFVEEERGHEYTSRPGVTLLDGAAFTAAWNVLVAEDAAEHSTEYADFTDIYRAMGIIDDTASLEEIWMRFGDAGVLGYYDSDTGKIVLRSGDITAFTKTVLVHELVHALDDQIFGIDRDEYAERDDEIDWTFSALLEGSAGEIESRYRSTLSQAERDEEVAEQRAVPRTVSLSDFTTSFLELQFGRYRYGDDFAAVLWSDGQDAMDSAFIDPPATSEMVIDPSAYLAGESTVFVDDPPADGAVFESGVWGEAAWAAVFADVFGAAEGSELADGWGGDRFVAWRQGSDTCVRAHVAGDSSDALDNYAFALEEWVTLAPGREVFYPTADLVRITACG